MDKNKMKKHFKDHLYIYIGTTFFSVIILIIIAGFYFDNKSHCSDSYDGICKTVMPNGIVCYSIQSGTKSALWCDSNFQLDDEEPIEDTQMY